ncbi:MAG: hypothetical protein H6713_01715 [Myxococcales bacterium]|nr:hypothetical protein [Myxococcales bacterium]
MLRRSLFLAACCVSLVTCQPAGTTQPPPDQPADTPTSPSETAADTGAAPAPTGDAPADDPGATNPEAGGEDGTTPDENNTAGLAPATTQEEAHVSRSVGVEGGVVVLWPRIIPRDIVPENRDLAAALQKHVRHVVEKNLPGRQIDFRPEPERVCPRQGCTSMSVGTLLSRHKQGCLVLALISRPGQAPVKIVPWAGDVKLKNDTVGFREYPEEQITVADYIPCSSLLSTMDKKEPQVAEALKAAAPPVSQ